MSVASAVSAVGRNMHWISNRFREDFDAWHILARVVHARNKQGGSAEVESDMLHRFKMNRCSTSIINLKRHVLRVQNP